MSNVIVGYFNVEESFEANGDIEIAIRDKRTGFMVILTMETFHDYDQLLAVLQENQHVGIFEELGLAS